MQTVAIVGATLVALFAILMGIAASVASRTSNLVERRAATSAAFWSLVTFAICAGVVVSLAGCSTIVKCIARDGTSNPCN